MAKKRSDNGVNRAQLLAQKRREEKERIHVEQLGKSMNRGALAAQVENFQKATHYARYEL